ncbi:MAG: hypothetical protein HY423_08835 [Candidatus Lambdaproteobacteria bacterium]|nr:hypothetical protein [Candidatus Lambdaproteobacteria bacterium]
MIHYELYSNVASTELGLQHNPELQELVDTFAIANIEVRVVKQVHREEDEVNVAQGKFAKGVTAKATAVKLGQPQTHLKGCIAWLRAVLTRPDRGLHFQPESVRATNGTALLLGRLYERNQRAFLSGVTGAMLGRFTALADPAMARIPAEIADSAELKQDYLARGARTGGFLTTLQQIEPLEFIPEALRAHFHQIISARDTAAIGKLPPAVVVNAALIAEALERYQRLLEQFLGALAVGELGGDLAPMFDLLTHGLPYPGLKEAFERYALENKREAITDRRSLLNELRIGLGRAEAAANVRFQRQFTALVIGHRLQRDPELYRRAIRLKPVDAQAVDVLGRARKLYLGFAEDLATLRGKGAAATAPVEAPLKQKVFELVVSLIFDSQFAAPQGKDVLTPGPNLARQLLTGFTFKALNLQQIRSLNPNLPIRGVARSLAEKVPIALGELLDVDALMFPALFPQGPLARELAAFIQQRFRDEEAQRRVRELQMFVGGAHALVGLTNYVLGRAGLTPVMRRALIAAGENLGIVVLESRDQIRNPAELETFRADGREEAEGYLLLMNRDESSLFPTVAEPDLLARSYQYLVAERVAAIVRRFVAQKIKYLFDRHGAGLFDVMHQHIVWDHGISLSRNQLALTLLRNKVFDQERLKAFGFVPTPAAGSPEADNRWLAWRPSQEPDDEGKHPFGRNRVEQIFKASARTMVELLESCRSRAAADATGDGRSLERALAELAEADLYDLRHPAAAEALASTTAAAQLRTRVAEGLTAAAKAGALPADRGEAIEIALPGPLAQLACLGSALTAQVEGQPVLVHLVPAWERRGADLDPASQQVVAVLGAEMQGGAGAPAAGSALRQALALLQNHGKAWTVLVNVSALLLIDQMLQESVLKLIRPAGPYPKDLAGLPEEKLLCLGTSSMDQAKFHRILAHPERKELFATLAEMASWMLRFQRMRQELEFYRDVLDDILGIVASFNLSVFDAPQLARLTTQTRKLKAALDLRPEDLTPADLRRIEDEARAMTALIRDLFEQERSLAFRDRAVSRVAIRLRLIHPTIPLTFVQRLHEQQVAPDEPGAAPPQAEATAEDAAGEEAAATGSKEYQTFSERVRNVIELKERLTKKEVFVLSPSNTQARTTLAVIERLYRLKGLFVPILCDVSGCESFVDDLRARLPPHRLFNLNQL